MNKKVAFCLDLDGTITREEILPLLARDLGLFEEMLALTEATIKGVIPFERSFKLRTMILNAIPLSRVQEIVGQVALSPLIVDFMQAHRENTFIVTGNLDVWLKSLVEKIGVRTFCSLADYKEVKLIGVREILNKGKAVEQLRAEGFEKIIAIGDGMGDVPMFEKSDYTIAYGGVHTPIKTLIELSNVVVFTEEALCRMLNTLL